MGKIRTTLTILVVLMSFHSASSADNKHCSGVSIIARDIMSLRQQGFSQDEIRNHYHRLLVEGGFASSYSDMAFIDKLINAAFQAVRASSIVERQRFVDAMRKGVYENCMSN